MAVRNPKGYAQLLQFVARGQARARGSRLGCRDQARLGDGGGGGVDGGRGFVVDRGQHPQPGVSAAAVIEAFDVSEHRGLRLGACRPRLAVDEVLLQARVEALDRGVGQRRQLRPIRSMSSELSV